MKLWLYRNDIAGGTPASFTATVEGENFRITITATQSAALVPGYYEWAMQVTNLSDATIIQTALQGTTLCLPNYMVPQTPTTAQAMVTLFEGVMREFAGTTRRSVNFAGQQFERASILDYQKELVYWQSRVLAEVAAINRARGGPDAGRIHTRFVPVFNQAPFGAGCGCNYQVTP